VISRVGDTYNMPPFQSRNDTILPSSYVTKPGGGCIDVIIVWTVWKEAEIAEKKRMLAAEAAAKTEKKSIAEEIRKQRLEAQVGSR